MSFKLNTRNISQGFIILLVLVSSLIVIPDTYASSGSTKMMLTAKPTFHSTFLADKHSSGTVVEPSQGYRDLHAHIFQIKLKFKVLIRKDYTPPTPYNPLWASAIPAITPLFSGWSGITKPAYYVFLFRYTLF